MTKLAVFDFDSTLMDGECINIVLNNIITIEKDKQILENIRAKSMRGELSLESSLKERIAHFEGLSLHRLEQICETLPWVSNAKETITELKKRGYLTLCLSGAFREATRRVITDLGMDAYCSNTLEEFDGYLTGNINGELMSHQSKGQKLAIIQESLNIKKENTIVVGDGANDVSMFAYADTQIAFCAEDIVSAQASCVIDKKDLWEVFRFIDS